APRFGHVAGWGAMTPPPAAGRFTKIAAGGHATLALGRDGTVAGWGDSRFGQQNIPADLSNVVDIAAAGDDYVSGHCLALKSDGTVVGWGTNQFGQITIPGGLSNVVAVA